MKKLSELAQKDMTRREFLALLGFGVATLVGFGSILNLLGKKNPLEQNTTGYGGGTYGGPSRSA